MKNPAHKSVALLAALFVALVSCSGDDGPSPAPVAVSGVALPGALPLPPGASAGLTAEIAPANATDKSVFWGSSNPAVATVEGSGLAVRVNARAVGTSSVTVTTLDGGITAACLVTVSVAVTDVTLAPTAMTLTAGRYPGALAATVEPADATDRNVAWSSSDPAVAAVQGFGAAATVIPVATGEATITVASRADAAKAATCLVTVLPQSAPPLGPGFFVACDVGLFGNGLYGVRDAYLTDVYVDARNNVHATGSGAGGMAVYVWNGEVFPLPCDAWARESCGNSMHVTDEGHVYIAGYQASGTRRQAMLWKDGETVHLDGSDGIRCWANSVRAHGNDVYVLGVTPTVDYVHALIWRNGEFYPWPQYEGPAEAITITDDGTVYVGGAWGLVTVDIDTIEGGSYRVRDVLDSSGNYYNIVASIFAVGNDVHAVSRSVWDALYYDAGRNRIVLPRDRSRWWSEAWGVSVSDAGDVYIAGHDWNSWSDILAVLWVNGVRQVLDSPHDVSYAHAVSARGAVFSVPVAGVTLVPAELSLGVDATADVVATFAPPDATNRTLTWTSSNTAVARVARAGGTVTVTGVGVGSATIRATSPDGPVGTCAVTVTPNAVASVSLPAASTVRAGGVRILMAKIEPANATNKNATWTSDNETVAKVIGDGLVARVVGVSNGAATITVTTEDGQKTAGCLVTVSPDAYPAWYVAGNFGLYIDGQFDARIGAQYLSEVCTDGADYHAVGWHGESPSAVWRAAHYKNGARTLLPLAYPGALEAGAHGITIDGDDVYIAGYEIPGQWPDETLEFAAMLWKNGVRQQLDGVGELDAYGAMYRTRAYQVRLHDGHVYVCGWADNEDHEYRAAIWKDGQKYVPNVQGFGGYDDGYLPQMAVAADGTIYVHYAHASNQHRVYVVDGGDPSQVEEYVLQDMLSWGLKDIAVDGDDFYASGLDGDDGCYWKNGVRFLLPKPPGANWVEANAVHATRGVAYAAGLLYQDGGFYIRLWRDGAPVPADDPVAPKVNTQGVRPASLYVD